MTDFTLRATVALPYRDAVEQVRDLLEEAGFGVLTEIDLAATLHAKLGVEIPPQVILGACRPQLARQALEADPRSAALLPCNVVVAFDDHDATRVEVFDPAAMASFSESDEFVAVATEARERLAGMLAALSHPAEGEALAARA